MKNIKEAILLTLTSALGIVFVVATYVIPIYVTTKLVKLFW